MDTQAKLGRLRFEMSGLVDTLQSSLYNTLEIESGSNLSEDGGVRVG